MTKGRQLPINSKVRRRLFEDDAEPNEPARQEDEDYLHKIIKTEYVARNLEDEVILKGMKWNFDFENEVALNGPIQWYRKGNGEEWVGMKATGRTVNMRKRKMGPDSAKSTYADERSKERKLPLHTVVRRRSFFDDERVLEYANIQAQDENFANTMMDKISPEYKNGAQYWNIDFQKRVPLEEPVDWQRAGDDWMGNVPGKDSRVILYPQVQNDDKTSEKETKPAVTDKKDNVVKMKVDEVEINATNNVTEKVRILYDKSMVTEPHTRVNMPSRSEDDIFLHEDIVNLEIEEISNMDVGVVQKELLNDKLENKNHVTPKNENNDPKPPVRKTKNLKSQIFGDKAKRRISFQ